MADCHFKKASGEGRRLLLAKTFRVLRRLRAKGMGLPLVAGLKVYASEELRLRKFFSI